VLVGVVGLVLGSIGTSLGLPNWIALLGGVAVLAAVLRFFGRPVPEIGGEEAVAEKP